MSERKRGKRRVMTGVVVSDKAQKTVVVEVVHTVRHRLYQKYVKRQARYQAHDENNEYKVGDKVSIIECRPLSKLKRWRVQNLIERPQQV